MIRTRLLPALVALLSLAAPRAASGQARGAVALDQLVRGLTTTSRVLVIGAHPDDEDTQLLAWLARGHQVQVAYLSLTRGDGGQNLIGNELGEALGAIRSEELLAARRLDGAQQFFSRAYDFGFSKDADETFRQWQREPLTADVVRVIRAYRPHVVIRVVRHPRRWARPPRSGRPARA
jgi:LmbE family N-acetylglucosaminyl deacetylase